MSHDNMGNRYDEGPPPPRDDELRHTIERIAEFVSKYGPESEEKARRDNEGNPKFGFLFGGPFSEYYKYRVHMHLDSQRGLGHPPPGPAAQQSSSEIAALRSQIDQLRQQIVDSERNLHAQRDSQPAMKEAELNQQIGLAEEQKIVGYLTKASLDITAFTDHLEHLNNSKCSKDAISQCKKWIFDACQTDQQREVILMYLLFRVKDSSANDNFRLNILYLINDWAHQCQRKKMDPVTQMLSRYVPQMYAFTIERAQDCSLQQKLDKLTGVWEGHKYFNDQCFKQLRNPSHIFATTNAAQSAEYLKLASNIEVQLQAMYAGYEQQHNNYAQHVLQQIRQLEMQIELLNRGGSSLEESYHGQQHHQQQQQQHQHQTHQGGLDGSGRTGAPPQRRSRFDQQSRFDDEEPRRGGGTGFGQFFAPPARGSQQQGWREEEVPKEQPPRMPDGDDIDGHPFNEDDLIPKAPYHELPAGIMVSQVPFENLSYKAIDPSALRMPPPVPPSNRLLEAIEMFYAPPTMDKPRDAAGWERDGMSEFFDRKLRLRKILEDKLMAEGKTLESTVDNKPTEEDLRLAKEDREATVAKHLEEKRRGTRRSRSPGASPKRGDAAESRSRQRGSRSSSSSSGSSSSSSSSRSSRSRSGSRGRRSRSRSASPHRTNRRSPTPPSFGGASSFHMPPAPLGSDNKGALLMQKMGWSGRGLGAQESGIVEPINPGEVRDKVGQFRGLGSSLDPYEQFRKSRSSGYHDRNQTVFAERERENPKRT